MNLKPIIIGSKKEKEIQTKIVRDRIEMSAMVKIINKVNEWTAEKDDEFHELGYWECSKKSYKKKKRKK